MRIRLLICFSMLFAVSTFVFGEFRIWTNQQGQSLEGEFVDFHENDSVRIRLKSNFRIYKYLISDLSIEDQMYLSELSKGQSPIVDDASEADIDFSQWFDDWDYVQRVAKERKRPILLFFTGSDWCGYCVRLKRNVLDLVEFKDFAGKKLVLMEVDFPRRDHQRRALKRQNSELKGLFSVSGYPTVFILDSTGKPLGKIGGYGGWSVSEYLDKIEEYISTPSTII